MAYVNVDGLYSARKMLNLFEEDELMKEHDKQLMKELEE